MSTFQTGSWFCSLLIGTESRKINANLQKSTVNQKPFLLAMSLHRYSSAINGRRNQARSQKFAMGGLFGGSGGGAPSRRRPMGVWGRSPQLPEAGGLGAKPPAAGGTGVWGRSPQRSKILHVFAKITSF